MDYWFLWEMQMSNSIDSGALKQADSRDMFRQRLDEMIDLRHPLAVLSSRLPWAQIEQALAPFLAPKAKPGNAVATHDLFGPSVQLLGAGVSAAGRPRLPTRLMASLLYLKHRSNMSDEDLVEHWAENVVWQYFSGMTHYEARLPCDATQIGRFRGLLGEAGVEELLKATIDCAVGMGAIEPTEFERVIVDTTVQEKAIAHPVDSRLLEIARHQVCKAAKAAGIVLNETHAKEGKTLRRKAGGYAHAKQFKRLKRTVKRQRTILGRVIRAVQRQLGGRVGAERVGQVGEAINGELNTKRSVLAELLQRAERIRTQQRHDKDKLYALHAPEVECIGKGKARKPYEFGVKVGVVTTHKQGLVVGARSFPGNPYDGHLLAEQLEQATILMEGVKHPNKPGDNSAPAQPQSVRPKEVIVDLGFRGVDADNPGMEIIHRGKTKTLTKPQWKLLKRRQAIEPTIGHLKQDHRMDRCFLKGAIGDALNAVLAAAGYNINWLLRAIVRLGLKGLSVLLLALSKLREDGAPANTAALSASKSVAVGKKLLPWNYTGFAC